MKKANFVKKTSIIEMIMQFETSVIMLLGLNPVSLSKIDIKQLRSTKLIKDIKGMYKSGSSVSLQDFSVEKIELSKT